MATLTHRITTASTVNGTSYASGAFTPAAGELLIAMVVATATTAGGTMTNSAGISMTQVAIGNSVPATGDTLYIFISAATTTAVSQTVTFDCTGDAATGCVIFVVSGAGLSGTGASAFVRDTGINSFAAAGTPATLTWGVAPDTNNPTIVLAANLTNPAGLTPPTNWTERGDSGYGTPTTGAEYATRDSGYSSTAAITWGGTSATAGKTYACELAAAAAVSRVPYFSPYPPLLAQ